MDKRTLSKLPFEEDEEDYDDEVVGWTLTIGTDDLLEQKERFKDLITAMESDDFIFMKQYSYLRRLLCELKEKHRKPKKDLISVI
jgi:hypothetical protein